MGRFLKNTFLGERKERIPHDWLNTIANFWNGLTVINGTLQRSADGRRTTIVCGGAAAEEGTIAPIIELGGTTEGTETAMGGTAGTWALGDTNGDGDLLACKLHALCRVVYNEAGDHKVYGYYREMLYDTTGKLNSISAETRIEIDAPISHGSL